MSADLGKILCTLFGGDLEFTLLSFRFGRDMVLRVSVACALIRASSPCNLEMRILLIRFGKNEFKMFTC